MAAAMVVLESCPDGGSVDEGVKSLAFIFVIILPSACISLVIDNGWEHGRVKRPDLRHGIEFAAPCPDIVRRVIEANEEFVHDDVVGIVNNFGLGGAFATVPCNGDALQEEAHKHSIAEQVAGASIAYSCVDSVGQVLAWAEGSVAAFISRNRCS